MKDELVSYETAKSAKEKSFDEECKYYYDTEKELDEFSYYAGNGTGFDQNSTCKENDYYDHKIDFLVPTQSLLQRWLRELHKIHIFISYNDFEKEFYYEINKKGNVIFSKDNNSFKTYEETLELGLREALKLIKL